MKVEGLQPSTLPLETVGSGAELYFRAPLLKTTLAFFGDLLGIGYPRVIRMPLL